ncbi:MAG: hypothetical protein K2X82_29385 [Gemmataceae bacterium]|nr:hypothetical protein [Gemmataceae bacterium]
MTNDPPRTTEPVLPKSATDPRPAGARSLLVAELRAHNKQLLRYGSAVAVASIALTLLALLSPVAALLIWADKVPALYLEAPYVLLAAAVALTAFHYIIRFDATNKPARAMFESLSDSLQGRELLKRRKPRSKATPENGSGHSPTAPPVPEQIDRLYPSSDMYYRLALKEYIAVRELPFARTPAGPGRYLIYNTLLLVGCVTFLLVIGRGLGRP